MSQPLPNVAHAYLIFAQEERRKEVAQITSHSELTLTNDQLNISS